MRLLQELVHQLVSNQDILDEVDRHIDIIRTRAAIEKEINRINTRARERVYEQKKQLAALRQGCSHPLTQYFPDAAGGSDSETQCKICDMRWHGNRSQP